MRTVPWFCLALAGAVLLSPAALGQTRRFDGAWTIEVVTDKGARDRAYRYSVVIENGRARSGGSEGFTVQGRVQPSGGVRASIARGQDRADVVGRLAGARGSGTWTTRGSRTCSGTWNADRRG